MVTSVALNGAGCAAAVPNVSVEANNKAANMLVFTAASPVELDCQLLAMREPISPACKLTRTFGAEKGEDASSRKSDPSFAKGCVLSLCLPRRRRDHAHIAPGIGLPSSGGARGMAPESGRPIAQCGRANRELFGRRP